MDTAIQIFQIVSVPVSLAIAFLGFMRTSKKDAKDDGKMEGAVMLELGYIKSGVDDIKAEQRQQRSWNEQMVERVAAVESSAKQAHHRIDELRALHDKE